MQYWGQVQNPNTSTIHQEQLQPIASLSPFIGRWSFKARVIDKGPKRTWSNAKSQGQLFSMTLVDDQGDAIRATVFQEGVEKFHDLIQNEKVYVFSKGTVKSANKKYSTLTNDYEVNFDQNSEIVPVPDDHRIVRQKFTIVPIASLVQKEKNTNVDLCAVVVETGAPTAIVTKAGESLRKRVVTIADQSEAQVELTLWQDTAERFTCPPGQIVAFKNCRVSDWSGVSVSLSAQGSIIFDPDIEQAVQLRHWLVRRGGSLAGIPSLTAKGGGAGGGGAASEERKTFGCIRDENLGVREDGKPDYLTVRATLTHIKQENMWYPACPTCSKKVTPLTDQPGQFRCDKCEKTTEANFRFIVSLTAIDHTGSQWLTMFQDAAEGLFHKTSAREMADSQARDPNYLTNFCRPLTFVPYIFRLRVREELVQDEKRIKCTLIRVENVNWPKECELLLREIGRYHALAA